MASFLRLLGICFLTVVFSSALRAETKTGPSLLFDARTGEVLAQDRAGEPWYPASLTKLMTAYVIFKKIRETLFKLVKQIFKH